MVNQAIEKGIDARVTEPRPAMSGRRLTMMTLGLVAALAVAVAVVPTITGDTTEAAVSAQPDTARSAESQRLTALAAAYESHGILSPGHLAEMARWEALVSAEYPDATAGAKAGSARWTALAATYQSPSVLTPGRLAEVARWEGLADQYTRAQTAEVARWNGLANHHQTHSPAVQAWADRYQGLADASG